MSGVLFVAISIGSEVSHRPSWVSHAHRCTVSECYSGVCAQTTCPHQPARARSKSSTARCCPHPQGAGSSRKLQAPHSAAWGQGLGVFPRAMARLFPPESGHPLQPPGVRHLRVYRQGGPHPLPPFGPGAGLQGWGRKISAFLSFSEFWPVRTVPSLF